MTDQEIVKYGEIQYLKGRLDELFKALSTITNIDRKRKVDQRIEKYFNKLKKVDEVAYHLYNVELSNRQRSKEKSKNEIKDLLEQTFQLRDNYEIIETKNFSNSCDFIIRTV